MAGYKQYDDCGPKFRRIGQGFCGSVWAAEGGTVAMKREDGGPGRSIRNDYNMHKVILEKHSQQKDQNSVCVPRWPRLVTGDASWWEANLCRFPQGYVACNVLCAERIPPLPQEVRDRLVDRYCPPAAAATIKNNDADRDCLVRLYLGRRKFQNEARGRTFFSLRNYPMHLNQAEELGLNVMDYAHAMAETLAMMHWAAKIDANDVEFVLGGTQRTGIGEYTNDFFGTHGLWVLDFDCCRSMTMDDAGIEQAARAFLKNDPYFPRPVTRSSSDSALWSEFRGRYLECSRPLLSLPSHLTLPEKFLARVEGILEETLNRRSALSNTDTPSN
ncbi:hypothetical protein Z517_02989 [Fonsecaea pedrosoi CBS 271.37]|uniref:DUF3669 domain-containing protein n=1 Tax=Fonsecaea pedrosoi CBS 271.37 TaxID=1442368 RepID=A0A0D2GRX8_9EURO|nr:uncharacterized protein Z517_02989 [Fonsecaea pedrosoi CBS 271.37]KIW83743.1 hypothetical protein Z517_02989 [Fonsecaea pedrosoi CBS 271.37]